MAPKERGERGGKAADRKNVETRGMHLLSYKKYNRKRQPSRIRRKLSRDLGSHSRGGNSLNPGGNSLSLGGSLNLGLLK